MLPPPIKLNRLFSSGAGFKTELFQNVSDDLLCVICCDVVRQSVVLPCGHLFCHECLGLYCASSKQPSCPLCRTPFTSIADAVDSKRIDLLVGTCIVKCPHKCGWSGCLDLADDHVATCGTKDDTVTECDVTGCTFKAAKHKMDMHEVDPAYLKSHLELLLGEFR